MYQDFRYALEPFQIFALQDIRKQFPNFDRRRLVEWQHKGYLGKIRRGHYYFKETIRNQHFLYYVANRIYRPSYISLESALSYYGLIPEGVFSITSVSSLNTAQFESEVGSFFYRHIKPRLHFGYVIIESDKLSVKFAEVEKALLDYFYLNKLNTEEEISSMRFNKSEISRLVDRNKLDKYERVFNSEALSKRLTLFKKVVYA